MNILFGNCHTRLGSGDEINLFGRFGYGIGYLRILSDTFANQVSVTSGTKWNCHTFANQYPDGDDR